MLIPSGRRCICDERWDLKIEEEIQNALTTVTSRKFGE
jgi:hypothetical protein